MYNNNKFNNNEILQLTDKFNKEVYNCARGGGQSCKNARNLYVEIDLLYNAQFPNIVLQKQNYARKNNLQVNGCNFNVGHNKRLSVAPKLKSHNKRVTWYNGRIIRGVIVQPIRNQPIMNPSYHGIHTVTSRFNFSGNNMETNKITRFI